MVSEISHHKDTKSENYFEIYQERFCRFKFTIIPFCYKNSTKFLFAMLLVVSFLQERFEHSIIA